MKVKNTYIHPDIRDYDTQDIIPPIQIFYPLFCRCFLKKRMFKYQSYQNCETFFKKNPI